MTSEEIELKEAITKSKEFLGEVFSIDIKDINLEEVVPRERYGGWMITFSYFQKRQNPLSSPLEELLNTGNVRYIKRYKKVEIDAKGTIKGITKHESDA